MSNYKGLSEMHSGEPPIRRGLLEMMFHTPFSEEITYDPLAMWLHYIAYLASQPKGPPLPEGGNDSKAERMVTSESKRVTNGRRQSP